MRNSVFGGGEIAAIGRGDVYGENDESPLRTLKGIYKAGKTKVNIYAVRVSTTWAVPVRSTPTVMCLERLRPTSMVVR